MMKLLGKVFIYMEMEEYIKVYQVKNIKECQNKDHTLLNILLEKEKMDKMLKFLIIQLMFIDTKYGIVRKYLNLEEGKMVNQSKIYIRQN